MVVTLAKYAILYWCQTGCQWRLLPDCFPNWNTVYGVYRAWRINGTWQRIHDSLREKVRREEGKKPTPVAAIIDSQSIRSAEGGELRGYDGAADSIYGRADLRSFSSNGIVNRKTSGRSQRVRCLAQAMDL